MSYLNNSMFSMGKIEMTLGPMFSGKSTYLISIDEKYKKAQISVGAINHADDTRYVDDNTSYIVSHNLVTLPCFKCRQLKDVWDYTNYDRLSTQPLFNCKVILIDEGQFYDDIYEGVINMVNVHHKHVYVCGLDGDFNRQPIGNILKLIPMCDKIQKLSSVCSACKKGVPGIFSKKIAGQTDIQIDVGGDDKYISVCRDCYSK